MEQLLKDIFSLTTTDDFVLKNPLKINGPGGSLFAITKLSRNYFLLAQMSNNLIDALSESKHSYRDLDAQALEQILGILQVVCE